MSSRAFGVEIECYVPDNVFQEYGALEETERCYGCESVCYECRYDDPVRVASEFLRGNGFDSWANLTDSDETLGDNGVEIKTQPLQGTEGFAELKRGVTLLNKHGFFVDHRCGLHVHHNAPDFLENHDLIISAVDSWRNNQGLIDLMVDQRRWNSSHCPNWNEEHVTDLIRNLQKGWNGEGTNRGAINFGSLSYHETIEIRQHEGTLDYQEIRSWIKFGQAFLDSISSSPIEPMTDEELLMRRIKVEKNASRFLSTKARLNKESIS